MLKIRFGTMHLGQIISIKSGGLAWISISSIGKISNDWIRDLGFNLHLHQKTDWCLGLMIKSYYQVRTSKVETLSKKKQKKWWVSLVVSNLSLYQRLCGQGKIHYDRPWVWIFCKLNFKADKDYQKSLELGQWFVREHYLIA